MGEKKLQEFGSELLGISQSIGTEHSCGLTPAPAVWQFCPMNKVPVNQKVPRSQKALSSFGDNTEEARSSDVYCLRRLLLFLNCASDPEHRP